MTDYMKLFDILMDELPEEHPWKGNIKGLIETLLANGVTFAKDTDVLTNADRIRAMSDEELMQFLFNEVSNNTICSFCVPTMRTKCKCDWHCKNGILEWLKQPAVDQ